MPNLYQLTEGATTGLFVALGTAALFYVPGVRGAGLLRRWSPQARRMLFRLLGCVFCTWGWARLFSALSTAF